jgi:hypothetical protein
MVAWILISSTSAITFPSWRSDQRATAENLASQVDHDREDPGWAVRHRQHLALSVLERVRELGLLRAIGMDRRQVRAMLRWS